MANYRAILKHHPEVREYIRLRKWVHRGETVSYGPSIESDTLSTDAIGYRNSVWRGRRMTLGDCIKSGRYGLVMGPSNVYGFGVPSDAHTIPSRLGEMLGLPFANIGLPKGTRATCSRSCSTSSLARPSRRRQCCCCRAAILPGGPIAASPIRCSARPTSCR